MIWLSLIFILALFSFTAHFSGRHQAWKDVRLTELSNQKEILKTYLEETFKERREMIDGLFDALDKGMDSGNMDVINAAIDGIINISKDSPLQNVNKIIHAMKDNDTKVISF
ncbi:hypothetical protein QGZ99_07665 [Kingella kingae]|nr:hypothetical protein [Kingella kingae]MDK4534943.1 hypothetical protein [Kingella kingae]MDK4553985.1 hypothetical protein [Kingella kingae]UOP02371.1 hypothetical protein LVJ79_07020 [Kingella kingae]